MQNRKQKLHKAIVNLGKALEKQVLPHMRKTIKIMNKLNEDPDFQLLVRYIKAKERAREKLRKDEKL